VTGATQALGSTASSVLLEAAAPSAHSAGMASWSGGPPATQRAPRTAAVDLAIRYQRGGRRVPEILGPIVAMTPARDRRAVSLRGAIDKSLYARPAGNASDAIIQHGTTRKR
jgi:hypothetical protein